ncbi:MAG: hypothetical protein BWX88_02572 [Planctomycetes bacterium ADurb.Bin126]|nr:MAG: hypothetical protein BWX88_02572 [Planctomycetes bacterium ADurb.Bin126]
MTHLPAGYKPIRRSPPPGPRARQGICRSMRTDQPAANAHCPVFAENSATNRDGLFGCNYRYCIEIRTHCHVAKNRKTQKKRSRMRRVDPQMGHSRPRTGRPVLNCFLGLYLRSLFSRSRPCCLGARGKTAKSGIRRPPFGRRAKPTNRTSRASSAHRRSRLHSRSPGSSSRRTGGLGLNPSLCVQVSDSRHVSMAFLKARTRGWL